MAAILLANVTHTLNHRSKDDRGNWVSELSIGFGNGALTYPTGGIPLDKSKLGLASQNVKWGIIEDSNPLDGYVYKFDLTNLKLKMFTQTGAAGALAELANTVAPAASIVRLQVTGF